MGDLEGVGFGGGGGEGRGKQYASENSDVQRIDSYITQGFREGQFHMLMGMPTVWVKLISSHLLFCRWRRQAGRLILQFVVFLEEGGSFCVHFCLFLWGGGGGLFLLFVHSIERCKQQWCGCQQYGMMYSFSVHLWWLSLLESAVQFLWLSGGCPR